MNRAKIQLSPDELALVQNSDWLLTKNKIIEKVYDLFGTVAEETRAILQNASSWLPAEAFTASPKISKGENYLGLPYVMLDYPRLFTKEDVFAIRTLFWWGNFFSVTLHLKGRYKDQYIQAINKKLYLFADNNFHICIGGDEWRHEFTDDNYISLKQAGHASAERILLKDDFCRLSARVSLNDWNQSNNALVELFRVIVNSIN